MREADFGLCLVSLAFLNSTYISDKELPYFLDETNPNGIIPIGLSKIDFGLHDLKGLEKKQLFRYNDRFFSQCRGSSKDDFVLELYKQIESRVDKLPPKSDKKKDDNIPKTAIMEYALDSHIDRAITPMSSEGRLDGDIEGFSNQVPVVKRLKEWFLSGDTPFCALLGDYGMGKTTTCKLLSQELKNTPPRLHQ